MAGSFGVIVGSTWNFTSKLFQSLSLGLWNQHGGEDTAKHEESEDLHDVVHPRCRVVLGDVTLCLEGSKHTLGNNGANLAGGSRETVRGGSVTGREAFSRNDESSGVRSKVEEELSDNVEGEETTFAQLVISETDDDEDNGQNSETHKLNGLATDGIDSSNCNPVARDGAGTGDDQVANCSVVKDFVDVVTLGISDGSQNDGIVQTETVVGDIEEKPGTSSSEKHFSELPLRVMSPEVTPRSLPEG